MKLISLNIRGLGSTVKRKEVLSLISKLRVDICCIQETKIESMDVNLCKTVWGVIISGGQVEIRLEGRVVS